MLFGGFQKPTHPCSKVRFAFFCPPPPPQKKSGKAYQNIFILFVTFFKKTFFHTFNGVVALQGCQTVELDQSYIGGRKGFEMISPGLIYLFISKLQKTWLGCVDFFYPPNSLQWAVIRHQGHLAQRKETEATPNNPQSDENPGRTHGQVFLCLPAS